MRNGWLGTSTLVLAFTLLALMAGGGDSLALPSQPPSAAKAYLPPSAPAHYVPPALRPWAPWVLEKHPEFFCPSSQESKGKAVCVFPSSLELRLQSNGASFTMLVHIYQEGRVRLPYAASASMNSWPQDVSLQNRPALVQEDKGVPWMLLPPGQWRIQGFLPWTEAPDELQVSPHTGLVVLFKQGSQKPEPFPRLAADGKLRLAARQQKQEKRPEDSIQTRVFRLVQDELPMLVTTLLRLDISGRARRIHLENALLQDSVPLNVSSPLPLQFAPDGGVYVQARPGRFDLRITSRMPGPVESLGPVEAPFGREFWAFEAHDSLRVVEVQGVPGIDPQTTDMPGEWKRYPAYLMEPGATMSFKQMHRGTPAADAGASGRLQIDRRLLLDFDGNGLTVQDRISGTLRNDWTLAMLPPADLGRVGLQGRDQPVVLLGDEQIPGVELRQSKVQLTAEARYEDFSGVLPAAGWDREFDSVSAMLHLPPGWRLLTATGVDGVDDSWVGRWSLLDIFLCLVIVLAVVKLRGIAPALVALLFLGLAWQEPNAPRQVWLLLLAALALYRVFAASERLAAYATGRRLALWLYGAALLAMAVVAVPFVYQQVNQALFPQLESRPAPRPYPPQMDAANRAKEGEEMQLQVMAESPSPSGLRRKDKVGSGSYPEKKAASLMYDPEALVQTGPGLPDWHWRQVKLTWSGPVGQGQRMELLLLSPAWHLALSLLRVALLLLVLFWLVDLRAFRDKSPGRGGAAAALALFCCAMALAPAAQAAEPPQGQSGRQAVAPLPGPPPVQPGGAVFPPQSLLQELEQRLLQPAACAPNCLSSPRLRLHLDEELLRLEVVVHAAARTMAPLPRVSDRWIPHRVTVDGAPASDLHRSDADLYVALGPGVHRVLLEGPRPRGMSFQVALPLASKQGEVQAPGWSVQGLSASGSIQGALRLAREKDDAAQSSEELRQESYSIPPFLEIRRELSLGLEWSVRTVVRRVSPRGEPVHLSVPLLPGESVLSEEVRVQGQQARIQLDPQQSELTWNSRLERSETLALQAPTDVPWVEIWQLAPANIWHLDISGIPETSLLGPDGTWRPTWRPWPGEEVVVEVSRPEAAPGASMTIEKAHLAQRVGQRLDENELRLSIRASKGGRHSITLPEDAELTALTASGRDLPLMAETPGVAEFPVRPGSQEVVVRWRQPRESAATVQPPTVSLQHEAVNADVRMELPRDRWVLATYGGPLLGPAVQYWTYLLAALVFALALGFLPWTPLKRWQWFLLAVGLSQLSPLVALCAVAWLPALGLRREHYPQQGWFGFDVMQFLLAGVVAAGLIALYTAVELGLLGLPHMQVAGNGSHDYTLLWSADRIAGTMPQPTVLTAPLWLFRVVMLAWSLWLAVSLLAWLKWGWESFSRGSVLRSPKLRMPAPVRRMRHSDSDQGNDEDFTLGEADDDARS